MSDSRCSSPQYACASVCSASTLSGFAPQRLAQRRDRLVLAPGAQVIERDRDLGRGPRSCSNQPSNAASASAPRPSAASASPSFFPASGRPDRGAAPSWKLATASSKRRCIASDAAEVLVQRRESPARSASACAQRPASASSSRDCIASARAEQAQVLDGVRVSARATRGRSTRRAAARPSRSAASAAATPGSRATSGTCRTTPRTRSR